MKQNRKKPVKPYWQDSQPFPVSRPVGTKVCSATNGKLTYNPYGKNYQKQKI